MILEWSSQFANDPSTEYELYLELLERGVPQAKIERDADGELQLTLLDCPQVRIPFRWLLSLAERVETLPQRGAGNDAAK